MLGSAKDILPTAALGILSKNNAENIILKTIIICIINHRQLLNYCKPITFLSKDDLWIGKLPQK